MVDAVEGLSSAKILIVNQSLGPMFHDFIEDLAPRIKKIVVICGQCERFAETNVTVISGPDYMKSHLASRLVSWLRFFTFAARRIASRDRSWLLFFASNPPMLPWLGLFFCFLRGQPYIIRILDVYPDIISQKGLLSKKNPVIRLWRWLNCKAYSRAAHVITLAPRMARTVSQYLKEDGGPVVVIPDWADITMFVPRRADQNPPVGVRDGAQTITVLYSGNLGFAHDLGSLIKAAGAIRDDPRFRFVIIGAGPGKPDLQKACRRLALTNVSFLPRLADDRFRLALAEADIGVVSMGKGSEGAMMPCKTYFSMAVGTAILGISYPPNDLAAIIKESRCGINVEPDDWQGIIRALIRFADDPEFLAECKRNSRKTAEDMFSRGINTAKLIDLVDKATRRIVID